MSLLIRFVLTLVLISLLIIAGYTQLVTASPTRLYQILLFMFITTTGLFYYLLRLKQQRPESFVQFYLLSMAIKLFASAGFMIYIISGSKSSAPANVMFFMLVYFVFTAVEVAFLYQRVNQ